MATLVVPPLDKKPWPTLGPQVVEFIEERWVYGPGDLRGEPYRVSDEFKAQIYRAYEVYPRGHAAAGKRRFKRVAWSERKGTAKTERAAILAACELHPEAPVRCDGFRRVGSRWDPVGRGVRDPYIPLIAYTEEQTEELAFGALYVILSESKWADDFDIGLERIVVLDDRGRAAGKAQALAGSPNARDGARTTFQHFDETHRYTLESLKRAHRNMLANIPKRPMADPWSLETTTSFTPGEGSIAESTMDYARAIDRGEVDDPRLFFFHRQAGDDHDLATSDGRRAAVIEASGPTASWSDIDSIVAQWDEPDADPAYLERVWLNRPRQAARQAFDASRWAELQIEFVVAARALVTVGFDGSRFRDHTGLVGTHVERGFQWPAGHWRAEDHDGEIPRGEVDDVVDELFDRFKVWRLYADPPDWDAEIDGWVGKYGADRVVAWYTNRNKAMAYVLRDFRTAQITGDLVHDGDPRYAEHVGNAQRHDLQLWEGDERLWVIRKERSDSPNKIDLAMAGALAWAARGDCIAAGGLRGNRKRGGSL